MTTSVVNVYKRNLGRCVSRLQCTYVPCNVCKIEDRADQDTGSVTGLL